MNPSFNPSTVSTRIASAIAAGVCTSIMLGSIDALADHFGAASSLASGRPIVVAQR